jgi:outer membrane protein assembly factor BamB
MNCKQWILVLCWGLFFCLSPAVVLGSQVLVPEPLLKQAGLQSSWQIQLPLKPAEQIDCLYVVDEYLYVLTNQNFFFCVQRDSGSIRSLLSIAVAGLPVLRPIQYEKNSAFLIGQELKVFDPVAGQITKTMKLSQLSGSYGSIARNNDNVYICGSDNRLYTFSAKEGTMLGMVTADNDSPIHSVIASDAIVWFATTVGNVVAMDSMNRQKLWQFNLSGKMTAPLILENKFIYAAGLDTKLYKLDTKTGKPAWKEPFITGDSIREPLLLGKTCVYVFTSGTGLYAVNKETGKAVWNLPRSRSVLAELDDQAYVYASSGVLTLMDNLTGKEKVSVDITGVERFAVNTSADSVLYLADTKGCVMAAGQIPKKNSGTPKP